jgi:hypothetical protein
MIAFFRQVVEMFQAKDSRQSNYSTSPFYEKAPSSFPGKLLSNEGLRCMTFSENIDSICQEIREVHVPSSLAKTCHAVLVLQSNKTETYICLF